MGYITKFSLSTSDMRKREHEEAIENTYYMSFWESNKWYAYSKNMKEYSLKFPEVVFELRGIGEEFPDIWVEFFQDGKSYSKKAIIMYPPYSESLLK